MARSHLCRIFGSGFGTAVSRLGLARTASSAGAHLWCMNTTETTTSDALHDDNVVHGAFEASYSLKDLAAELQVSAQTI